MIIVSIQVSTLISPYILATPTFFRDKPQEHPLSLSQNVVFGQIIWNTEAYISNVSRLAGIPPDEPIGIPMESPARWMMVAAAMAIQENGTSDIDYFAMLRGWTLSRENIADN